VALLDYDGLRLPANARMALAFLVNQMREPRRKVDATARELARILRINPLAKFLCSLRGIGP